MKKILVILPNLLSGGIEKLFYELVSDNHAKYRFDFLICPYAGVNQMYEPLLTQMGCNIFKATPVTDKISKMRFLKKEYEILIGGGYDAVHSNMESLNGAVCFVARLCGISCRISHTHSAPAIDSSKLGKLRWYLHKIFIKMNSTACVGCSKLACDRIYQNAYKVIYNGIDIQKFRKISTIARKPHTFIVIGRIDVVKNPPFICEIMRELVKIRKEYSLIWVGKGSLSDKVKNIIKEYGLEKNVTLVGETTDVISYLQEAQYGLLPSLHEGFPLTMIEMQVGGVFCFYSDTITDEANIGFAKSMSLDENAIYWAQHIDNFIEMNEISNYRVDETIAEKLDFENFSKEIIKLYNNKA